MNLLKMSSFARYKGVSVETVRLWIKSKKIKSKCIDGVYFVSLSDEEYEIAKKYGKGSK